MKATKPGFLLIEALTGLLVTVIGVGTLFLCLGKTKQVINYQEQKIDHYLAAEILINTDTKKVMIHNHNYSLLKQNDSTVEIYNETTKQKILL